MDEYTRIDEAFQAKFGTTYGQMFGKACLKVNGKAFAAFFHDEMVFKLGAERIEALRAYYEGSVNWDPSGKGRPMKDWLQIPANYQDQWQSIANDALDYVKENMK